MDNICFYLSTCSTCKRILSSVKLPNDFRLQDIKENPVTETQLEALKTLSWSYEALFSKRAQLYRQQNLKDQNLQEEDYKRLLLSHYTFLKRPVFVVNGEVFIGNSKKTVEALQAALLK